MPTSSTSSTHPSSYRHRSSDYANVRLALQRCWAPSTRRTYSRGIQHFFQFCADRKIPESLCLPAHESVLLVYAASHLDKASISTVQHRLNALKAYHTVNNLPWNGSPRLSKVLRGIKLYPPTVSRRPQRAPVTASMLARLIEKLDLKDPQDAAIAACACTTFWGQCRLGELIPSRTSDLSSPNNFPARHNLTRTRSSRRRHSAFFLKLPTTKTQRLGQTVTLLAQSHPSNPLPLLQHHLHVNSLPPHAPLFAFSSSQPANAAFTTLSKEILLSRCNAIWMRLGYPRVTGHSFRIGGTSHLLAAGIPPDVVKSMGRWVSDSFLRYWRNLDRIASAQTPGHSHTSHPRL